MNEAVEEPPTYQRTPLPRTVAQLRIDLNVVPRKVQRHRFSPPTLEHAASQLRSIRQSWLALRNSESIDTREDRLNAWLASLLVAVLSDSLEETMATTQEAKELLCSLLQSTCGENASVEHCWEKSFVVVKAFSPSHWPEIHCKTLIFGTYLLVAWFLQDELRLVNGEYLEAAELESLQPLVAAWDASRLVAQAKTLHPYFSLCVALLVKHLWWRQWRQRGVGAAFRPMLDGACPLPAAAAARLLPSIESTASS